MKVPDKFAGKRAKCPGCQSPVQIPQLEPVAKPDAAFGFDDFVSDGEPVLPPPRARKPKVTPPELREDPPETVAAKKKAFGIPVVAGVAVGCLVLGFFTGRWHLQHQISSAFAQVGESFARGLQSAAAEPAAVKPTAEPISQPELVLSSEPDVAPVAQTIPPEAVTSPDPEPVVKTLGLKEKHTTEFFSIGVATALIGKVPVIQLGQKTESTEPRLVIQFYVENTHDRKLLNIQRENEFTGGHYRLKDDVGNSIRGVSFGLGATPVGAVDPADDIEPGGVRGHVVVFTVPPPKTEFLMLEVDLESMLGHEGTVMFKLDAADIKTIDE